MHSSVNILVVDDDRMIADLLKEYLSGRGHAVTTVYSGREALAALSGGKFSIVIVDMKMPDVDGMAVLERVKKTDRDTLVIMITGYGTLDSAVAAINHGAYDFIAKPFQLEEFKIVIRRAIERHRSLKQLGLYRRLMIV